MPVSVSTTTVPLVRISRESTSKDDRGVVHVETIGYNQDGKVVCIFRRKVMVPKANYLESRGGEQPARPDPQPDKNWPGGAKSG